VTIQAVATATLGDFNIGLVAAVGLVIPLSAQLDALLSVGLGPFKADVQVQFNASLSAVATLSLQIGDPLAALKLAISAMGQLQAALQLALALPPINLSLSAELGASAALAGALSARLGLLNAAISLALQIKLGALEAAADLQASLSAGPVIAIAFSGETFGANAAKIETILTGGTADGFSVPGLSGSDALSGGVVLATGNVSAAASLNAIITV